MRLTVFGATGGTGRILVAQALERGHEVTAFARRPDRLSPRAGLHVVAGSLDDAAGVRRAVEHADAVISLLGPPPDRAGVAELVPGMRTIVAAMEQAGIRRLVATATPSARDPDDGRDRRVTLLVKLVRFSLPHAYNAVRGLSDVVRESSLDWTIVRVPILHDGERTTGARARRVGEPGSLMLSRGNLAAFVLEEVASREHVRGAPLVADATEQTGV